MMMMWWPVFMVVCMAVMALMMGHGRMPTGPGGMHGSGGQHLDGHETDASERILEERLARGEIDIKEYRRMRATRAKDNSWAGGKEDLGDQQ